MVQSAREVYGSVRVGGGNEKSTWGNDQVKAKVKRKEDAWKEVMGARDEDAREMCLKIYTKRKRERLKGVFFKVRRRSKNSLEGK